MLLRWVLSSVILWRAACCSGDQGMAAAVPPVVRLRRMLNRFENTGV